MVLWGHKHCYFKCRQLILFHCPNNKRLKHHSQWLLGRKTQTRLSYLCWNFLNTKINCIWIWEKLSQVRHSTVEKKCCLWAFCRNIFLCWEDVQIQEFKDDLRDSQNQYCCKCCTCDIKSWSSDKIKPMPKHL